MRALGLVLAAVAGGLFVPLANAAQVFDCVIQPASIVRVGTPVTGILTEVHVRRGDWVDEGDVLARLEDRLEQATVALQEMRASDRASLRAQAARLALAQARMERFSHLLSRGTTTQDAFDEAKAELEVNQAELERLEMQVRLADLELARAEAALSLRTIVSPIAGLVTQKVLSPGEFVNQDAFVLLIADVDPLHVEVFLPVSYYSELAIGDVGKVSPLEPVGGSYEAEVTVIDRVFDAASNTFGVRLSLSNPDGQLPAGQRCTVELNVGAASQ